MNQSLKRMERELRNIAKRCKNIKYTKALLISFLMTGTSSFADSAENIIKAKKELKTSITDMKNLFKNAKKENNKLMRASNLELIQLMEQGDHVVKSPWSSWQFGTGYTYNNAMGDYKGRGDSLKKYAYSGILERDANELNRYMLSGSESYLSLPTGSNPASAATNMRNGIDRGYGLVEVKMVREEPREIALGAGIRIKEVNKTSPASTPSAPTIVLPSFEPRLVQAPIIQEKTVTISPAPTPPATDVGYQEVPGDLTGYRGSNTNINGGIISQLELTGGTYNLYFRGYGGSDPIDYNFINTVSSGTPSPGFVSLPTNTNGSAAGTEAFYRHGGKALTNIGAGVTVNVVGNNQGNDLNTVYYLGNNGSAGNPESKLVHYGVTNLYGDKIAVVNIDNVSSPGNITFKNEGSIIGHAEKGDFVDGASNHHEGAVPGNHIFGAYSYGDDGEDTIENGANGKVLFYAPNSVGWAYTSGNTQSIKRSSINNGIMRLYGNGSIGVTTDADALETQVAYADIQLNTPIEIYGDNSAGINILTEPDTSSTNFENSKFNIEIGGAANFVTQTGSGSGDTDKVEGSLGINMDFTLQGYSGTEKTLKNYRVVLGDKAKTSTAIRSGYANIKIDDTPVFSTVTIGGESNVGFLSDGINGTSKLTYNNTQNRFTVTGKNHVLFAAKEGGELIVKESVPLGNVTTAEGFTAAYSEGTTASSESNVTFEKGVRGIIDENSKSSVLFYAKGKGKITVTETTAPVIPVPLGGIINNTALGTPKIHIKGKGGVGYYATSSTGTNATILADNSYTKIDKGEVSIFSDGANSDIKIRNSIIDYDGEGYAIYSKNNGKIDLSNSMLVLRGKAVGFQKIPGSTDITLTGLKVLMMSDDAIPFAINDHIPQVRLSTFDTDLGIGGIDVIKGQEGSTIYQNFRKAVVVGMNDFRIDSNIDKSLAADIANESTPSYQLEKRYVIQKAKTTLETGNSVTSHLDGTQLTAIGIQTPVGLDMNSSNSATSRSQTGITLQSGSTVSADRTDAGAGAVGLFINYGEVNIDGGASVNVEKSGINGENDGAVGVFAVNDSAVNNSGVINVGGKSSIGILGLSYRTDNTGLRINEFNQTTTTHGDIDIKNHNQINLNGENAVGIYVENNDSTGVAHDIKAENVSTGTITMTGLKAAGMAAKKGNLINAGTLNMTGADQGVAMFGETSGTLTNNGIISTGDAASESTLRIGIFTTSDNIGIVNSGTINAGKNSYAIYGKNVTINGGTINIGENGVGIFSKASQVVPTTTDNVTINSGAIFNVGNNNSVGVFTENDSAGIQITDNGSTMHIGNNSYGYVFKGQNTKFSNTVASNATIGQNSVYIYSNDSNADITNNVSLTSASDQTYGIYSAGTVVNNGNFNFAAGVGNVGIYSIKGGTATNNGNIIVGETYVDSSDSNNNKYAIGMAAGYQKIDSGNIINNGTIDVRGNGSIGMYASGSNSYVRNSGTINLSEAGAMGIYLDEGARGDNYGTIQTVGSPAGVIAAVLRKGAILTNHPGAKIVVDSDGGAVEFRSRGGMIVNYGEITVRGGATHIATPQGNKPLDKTVDGIRIDPKTGTVTRDGLTIQVEPVTNPVGVRENILYSPLAMYIDTLRKTNPINGYNNVGISEIDLMVGAEAADVTNSRDIKISGEILKPYNQSIMNSEISNVRVYSGALTWFATGTLDNLYISKIPYTSYSSDKNTTKYTYNFTDGLEQRYSMNNLDSREKAMFNKLNRIGKNEETLLYQAFDQMMGHQYANVQQRIHSTGQVLDSEIGKLSSEWKNTTKNSNKITTFGIKGEYNTNTAGIINYTNNAFGVAYIHENEAVKLGDSSGWYAGAVNNTFKLKDIGKSKENVTMLKAGIFKTMSPKTDHNGSSQWTVSGEAFVSRSALERKYLIVDEIFKAKSDYTSYGAAVKNEIGKSFRIGEKFSIRPYGALKLEYGRFNDIKEKSGEVRLEIKGNDYFSIKPEFGTEFIYKKPMAVKANFITSLGLGYENELGKTANVKNKVKVSKTTADYYTLVSEKEDRKGNFKADLNIGIENQKFGVTINAGYDTKGENIRGGIGFRVIY